VKTDLFEINPPININDLSYFSLSYMGDALFEVWCRQKILLRFQNRKQVHNSVVQWVRCQTQAKIAMAIEPIMTVEEKKVYSRGRNGKVISPPKHSSIREYRAATGFECLVGYLYFKKETRRFEELMNKKDVLELMESILFKLKKNYQKP